MPINVSEALDTDTAEIVTVTRTNGVTLVDGLFVSGPTSTFKTLASVQQPTVQQLQLLPEGSRDQNPRLFICKKPMRTNNDKDGTVADKIRYKGIDYLIISLGDWSTYGHSHAFGVRVE